MKLIAPGFGRRLAAGPWSGNLASMARKRYDCAGKQLAATNPFSVHRSGAVLRWSLLLAVGFCVVLGLGLYLLNRL